MSSAYIDLRWKLMHSPDERICFEDDIEISCIDDGGTARKYLASGIRLTRRGQIITQGNRCPQVEVTSEETLRNMLRAKVWRPKDE